MHTFRHLKSILCGSALLIAVGCGSSRDVKVSGNVTTSPDVAATDPIHLDFYERTAAESDGGADKFELVHSVGLATPGDFSETVALTGDNLVVVAIADADGNAACTDGEAWGRAEVTVDENNDVTLNLDVAPQTTCPVLDTTE